MSLVVLEVGQIEEPKEERINLIPNHNLFNLGLTSNHSNTQELYTNDSLFLYFKKHIDDELP